MDIYGRMENKIGEGTFGQIYQTSQNYAVKIIKTSIEPITPEILCEIVYPSLLKHPNIIRYHHVKINRQAVALYMDLYQGDLLNLVKTPKYTHNLNNFQDLARQLISIQTYLTSKNIMHRDIKPENILYRYDSKYTYVLTDFGLGLGKETLILDKGIGYTIGFRPPEVILNSESEHIFRYDNKSEVWALGCTLYYGWHGKYLFTSVTPDELIVEINQKVGGVTPTCSFYTKFQEHITNTQSQITELSSNAEINDLLVSMIQPDPILRKSIYDLQTHSFIQIENPIPVPTKLEQLQFYDQKIQFQLSDNFSMDYFRFVFGWLVRLKDTIGFSNLTLIMTAEIASKYMNKFLVDNLPLLVRVCLYLSIMLIESGPIPMENLLLKSEKTSTQFKVLVYDIIIALSTEIMAATMYDRLMIQDLSEDILNMASHILLILIPFPEYYYISEEFCVNAAQFLLEDIRIDPKYESWIEDIKIFYKQNPSFLEFAPDILKRWIL